MLRLLVFFSLAMFCLSTLGAASKCDEKILNLIRKKFWNNGQSIPTDFFKAGTTPLIIKITTKDYYPDEENVVCVFSTFEDSTHLSLHIQYVNSTLRLEPPIVSSAIEKDGAIIDEENGIYRYHVYTNRCGVTTIYTCSEKGEIGAPKGVITVSSRGYDKRSLAQSVKDMASLGIIMSKKVYSDDCLPQNPK